MTAPAEPLAELWRDHAAAVWAYAARRVGRDEADDVVSRVFEVALSSGDLSFVRKPRAWLLGVAHNVTLEIYRSRKRAGALSDRLLCEVAVGSAAADPLDPGLLEGLRSLDPLSLEMVLLVAWDSLTPREVAAALGLSPAAVRMRLMRARRHLRKSIAAAGPDGMPGYEIEEPPSARV